MQRFQRLVLAIVAAILVVSGVPQRSDAAVFVGVSVNFGPPALPVYVQPPAPYVNAIWQPGYWGWGGSGYYWVPGTWVTPPRPGFLWTPGYWGFGAGIYSWHPGYWATRVGFYGGINYGFGYYGNGFVGGAWFGNVFRYNTAVMNVNTTIIHNTYIDRTVVVNNNFARVSYNGGTGVRAYPTAEERAIAAGPHYAMTPEQRTHATVAQENRENFSSFNRGRPAAPAYAHPLSRGSRQYSYHGPPR